MPGLEGVFITSLRRFTGWNFAAWPCHTAGEAVRAREDKEYSVVVSQQSSTFTSSMGHTAFLPSGAPHTPPQHATDLRLESSAMPCSLLQVLLVAF